MISKNELKEIIIKKEYPKSITRKEYVEKISSWMKRKEIIIIKGIRRSGKTHLMYQLIKKISKKNTFYVNFDDFRFNDYLNVDLLETIINLRDKNKRAYFFLDEIQRVKGFEKWLRTYYDKEDKIKFIIGGSNISLMSPEMGTVLTGRNITFKIFPLSYNEFQKFSNKSFEEYLEYGGFPEVVLEKDETKKRELLRQYLSDIVDRDIVSKYNLENPRQLKALINFFLINPGVRISANKLGSQLGIHKDTAQKYISYIMDTFLIFEVPFFSYSAKTKYIGFRASKYYTIDNGFNTIASIKKDKSKLYENIIAIRLASQNKEIMYWLDNAEIDFVYDQNALQVTATDKIPLREITAFNVFEKKHRNFKKFLINPNLSDFKNDIKYVKLKEFLNE